MTTLQSPFTKSLNLSALRAQTLLLTKPARNRKPVTTTMTTALAVLIITGGAVKLAEQRRVNPRDEEECNRREAYLKNLISTLETLIA